MRLALLPVLALCGPLLAGCGDDPVAAERPSLSASGGDSLDCVALLPDTAFAAFGWEAAASAEEHAGRCERRVSGAGAATVATRAVTSSGDDAVRRELDATCDGLREEGGYVDQPVGWLRPARPESCATGLAQTRTGVAELYFINDADELVQIRVEALSPLAPESLEAGMTELAEASADLSD